MDSSGGRGTPTLRSRLIIVTGQEGVGKSTIVRALLPHTPMAARIDAEDVGRVNPWQMSESFVELLWTNVACLAENFWRAGYVNVIAGSFISNRADFDRFRPRLRSDVDIHVVQLRATRECRDRRRIHRDKPTSPGWRDRVEAADPEDVTLARDRSGYSYCYVDNTGLSVDRTVRAIRGAIPRIYQRT